MNKLVDKFETVIDQQPKKDLPIKTGPQQPGQTNGRKEKADNVIMAQPQKHNQNSQSQSQSSHTKEKSPQQKEMQAQLERQQKEKQDKAQKQLSREHSHTSDRTHSSHHSSAQHSPHTKHGTQIVRMSDSGCSPIGNQPFEPGFQKPIQQRDLISEI